MQAGPDNNLPLWTLPLFPIFFAAVWSLACIATCWLTGWHSLAKRFKTTDKPYGDIRSAGPWFYSVYFRFWGHYSSVIRIEAAQDALYLSVFVLFRIGHPPLHIPWEEIRFGKTKWFWRPYVVLTLGREEQIPMRISVRMACNLGIFDRLTTAQLSS
jgi:hypothetical protein